MPQQQTGSPVTASEYLDPDVPGKLPWHEAPLVPATPAALQGLGAVVDNPADFPVDIVPWPVSGWRALDPGTGTQGGTTTGTFGVWWEGDVLFGRNDAVGGHYLLGWSTDPANARRGRQPEQAPGHVLLWHVNYHPTGVSSSFRSTAPRSSYRWRRRVTTSGRRTSSPFRSGPDAGSTSSLACGTTRPSRSRPGAGSTTSRAGSTRG